MKEHIMYDSVSMKYPEQVEHRLVISKGHTTGAMSKKLLNENRVLTWNKKKVLDLELVISQAPEYTTYNWVIPFKMIGFAMSI